VVVPWVAIRIALVAGDLARIRFGSDATERHLLQILSGLAVFHLRRCGGTLDDASSEADALERASVNHQSTVN
jgi:hypothetical protein